MAAVAHDLNSLSMDSTLRAPRAALRTLGVTWLAVAICGQLAFATYIVGFYGVGALVGDLARWNKVMPHGYLAGDTAMNAVLGIHLLFAAVILVGGMFQLLPVIRRRVPAVHRWTGRLYVLAAALMSIGGLTMVWGRGAVGDVFQHITISLNAALILICAALALVHARARHTDYHRRWALRLFLAVSGVWFFRIGLMFWIVVNAGPVGFDPDSFTGPALNILGLIAYVAPIAGLQVYFWLTQRGGVRAQWIGVAGLGLLTLMTAVGIFAAGAFMWWPRLAG